MAVIRHRAVSLNKRELAIAGEGGGFSVPATELDHDLHDLLDLSFPPTPLLGGIAHPLAHRPHEASQLPMPPPPPPSPGRSVGPCASSGGRAVHGPWLPSPRDRPAPPRDAA